MQFDDYKLTMMLQHLFSTHEADAIANMLYDEDYTAEDIIEYIDWCKEREDIEFSSWLDDRKPRVHIEILVTECGCPIHEELDFPKRGEDMDHGTEYEWYYSLKEVEKEILALPVHGSMNFKIRDDKDSHGVIIRLA